MDKTVFPKIVNGDRAIAYIQSNSDEFSSHQKEGAFGDIVIYNFDDSCLYSITDNYSYEEFLTYSPVKKSLLFAKSKKGILKEYYHGLYSIDFQNGTYSRFADSIYGLDSIDRFTGLQWTKNGMYFSELNNLIYLLDSLSNLNIVLEIEEGWWIRNQLVSPNNKYIAFNCVRFNPKDEVGLGLFHIESKRVKWLAKGYNSWKETGIVRDWSKSGDSFLYSHLKLHSYNVITNKDEEVYIPGSGSEIIVEECKYLNEEELALIYRTSPEGITQPTHKNYIGVYNMINNTLTKLPVSDRQKQFLTLIQK